MSGRILRCELRRSGAVWAGVISLVLVFSWPSVPDGMSGVVGEQRTALANLVPLAMGLGAWQARRDRRSRMPELLATTARPEWQRRLHVAGALGLGVVAGAIAALGGLTVYALVIGAYVPAVVIVASVVIIALCLAAGVWLGLAIGRAAPWVPIPPLLVVGGSVGMIMLWFVADTEGYRGGPPAAVLLFPAGSTGFDAFETLTGEAHLAQVALVVGIAGSCLLLGVARWFRLAAVVPVGVGVVVALWLLPARLYDTITLDRGAAALVCTSDEPRVCARRMHPHVLDELRSPGQEALTLLAAKLPEPPTRVVEAFHGNDAPTPALMLPRADTVWVEVDTGGDLLWEMLLGAGTLPCDNVWATTDGRRYAAARLVAAAWLLGQDPPAPADPNDPALPSTSLTRPAYEALLSAPPAEQRARVAALREAELACDPGDRLAILAGGGGGA